jgi:hypothetical protein
VSWLPFSGIAWSGCERTWLHYPEVNVQRVGLQPTVPRLHQVEPGDVYYTSEEQPLLVRII